MGQAETALLLVDQTLTAQMGQEETDLRSVAVLQYAQGTFGSGQIQRPVEDAQAMLAILGEQQAAARPAFLNPLDRLGVGLQNALQKAALLQKQAFSPPAFPEIDEARLQEAARLERLGRLAESAQMYETLLQDYPDYSGRSTLKLRLGYVLQRDQDLNRADQLYREASREGRTLQETQTARQMLENLLGIRSIKKKADQLELRLAKMEAGSERQGAAFKLGSLLIQANDLRKAPDAFREAFLADSEGELALPALFKEGWCLRASGRFEEALARFSELTGRDPKGSWGAASAAQIAEIYKALGDYSAAAEVYERALTQSKDDALTSLLYASAASTYLFDLNNPAKAQLLFRDMEKRFPASPFSSISERIQELQRKKGAVQSLAGGLPFPAAPSPQKPAEKTTFSLTEGGPVVNWLEGFLPVFVDVFSDRLAKYMHAVGETELQRRFTEIEFKDLVVRQVQKKFPGQVTDIDTKIRPDGFVGSGNVKLGILRFSVQASVGITVVDEKPHAAIREIKIGGIVIPKALQDLLETRVNSAISRGKYPLKVKKYELREGYALISVELAE